MFLNKIFNSIKIVHIKNNFFWNNGSFFIENNRRTPNIY